MFQCCVDKNSCVRSTSTPSTSTRTTRRTSSLLVCSKSDSEEKTFMKTPQYCFPSCFANKSLKNIIYFSITLNLCLLPWLCFCLKMHYFLLFQKLGSPAPSWPLLGSPQDRIKCSQLYLMLRSSSLSRACLSLCHCLARIDSTDDWAYLTSAFSWSTFTLAFIRRFPAAGSFDTSWSSRSQFLKGVKT